MTTNADPLHLDFLVLMTVCSTSPIFLFDFRIYCLVATMLQVQWCFVISPHNNKLIYSLPVRNIAMNFTVPQRWTGCAQRRGTGQHLRRGGTRGGGVTGAALCPAGQLQEDLTHDPVAEQRLHGEVAPQEWVPRDGVAEPATNVAAGGLGPVALHDDHSSTSSSMALAEKESGRQ
jgi:hypothetical protein